MKKGTAIFLLLGLAVLVWGVIQQAKWTFSEDNEPAQELIVADES